MTVRDPERPRLGFSSTPFVRSLTDDSGQAGRSTLTTNAPLPFVQPAAVPTVGVPSRFDGSTEYAFLSSSPYVDAGRLDEHDLRLMSSVFSEKII